MKFNSNRLFIILAGIVLLTIGLFISNPIVGILICVLLAATTFYDEKMAIYFLIITIPVRPFLLIFNSGYKAIGDILILFLLLKVIYDNRKNIRQLFRFNLIEITFILFIVVGVISALITGVSIPAIIIQVRAFLLFFLLFYIVKRMRVDKKDVYDFAMTTFITAIILAVHGLIEKISNRTLLLPEVWESMDLSLTNKIRIYGLIGGPNEMAIYMAIAFFISFYLLRNATGKLRAFVYTGMILILTVFILTYSRGAVLGIGAFIIAYLAIYKKFAHFKSIMIILVSSAILFSAVGYATNYVSNNVITEHAKKKTVEKKKVKKKAKKKESGLNRFSGAFSKDQLSKSNADGRVYYVKKAVEVFKDRPVIGYGFGTFGGAATLAYSSPIYEKYDIKWNFYSDNQYIQILAETGIVGTILIFITVISMGVITWKSHRRFLFSPMLIFFLSTALASGIVYNVLEIDIFTLYFFIFLGFGYQYLNKTQTKDLPI